MSADNQLTRAQRDDLRTIAAMIVPASDEYKVPGADDPAIQADILTTLGRDTKLVAAALDHLARLAGQPFAELDAARRDAVAQEFRSSQPSWKRRKVCTKRRFPSLQMAAFATQVIL